jgi:hypothetical protein
MAPKDGNIPPVRLAGKPVDPQKDARVEIKRM